FLPRPLRLIRKQNNLSCIPATRRPLRRTMMGVKLWVHEGEPLRQVLLRLKKLFNARRGERQRKLHFIKPSEKRRRKKWRAKMRARLNRPLSLWTVDEHPNKNHQGRRAARVKLLSTDRLLGQHSGPLALFGLVLHVPRGILLRAT